MPIVFDIETDGLWPLYTKVHCICTIDVATKEAREFHGDTLENGLAYLSSASRLIGHNIVDYDLNVLLDLHGFKPSGEVVDTLILSRLLFPDRVRPYGMKGKAGPHSLEAWAIRLGGGLEKVVNEQWDVFTSNMLQRCKEDVKINLAVYEALLAEANN